MAIYNKFIEIINDFIKDFSVKDTNLISKLIGSLIIVALILIAKNLLLVFLDKRFNNDKKKYLWKKYINTASVVLLFMLIFNTWSSAFKSLTTFLGILSAGFVVALKEPVTNLAGWLFLMIRKPFSVGDRIQIGKDRGDVIDIRPFEFTILEIGNWIKAEQSTGRMIHIPNGRIFVDNIANYDVGFDHIWNEISVLVTFESNWRKAKEILAKIINEHSKDTEKIVKEQIAKASKRFLIKFKTLTPKIYTSVEDSGINLTIRYLCTARQRRGSSELIWESILGEFEKQKDIDFAYPTIRYYSPTDSGTEN